MNSENVVQLNSNLHNNDNPLEIVRIKGLGINPEVINFFCNNFTK